MRTVNTPAFGGRVVFMMRHLSLGTASWIDRQLEALPGNLSLTVFRNLVFALRLTVEIEFHFQGDENPMLEEFRDFWQAYQAAPEDERMALAIEWRLETSPRVMDEWIEAVNAGTQPFRDPARLPGSALTEEEKRQARDPNSPLASSGAKSGSAAATAPEASSTH